ncbi:GNAT family N-acetyltransferase [Halomarina litorea]|uniref:GNAT family N-acetyltransferase n=1 Tax=Halomarina litorea TaxID=2961595 RepID=UPI0020C1DD7A|nr:GNAT family N-acetyltransferase [Halomarina sp. BCD28]
MSERVVRVDTDEALSDALAVRHEVFVEGQDVPEDLEYDEWDDDDRTVHFVAYAGSDGGTDGARPVGAARLRPYREGVGKVQRVAVREAVQGEGWGRRLMDELEAVAGAEGYERLELDAQTHAVGFYERLGYHVTSEEEFLDAGIPHLAMAKALRNC